MNDANSRSTSPNLSQSQLPNTSGDQVQDSDSEREVAGPASTLNGGGESSSNPLLSTSTSLGITADGVSGSSLRWDPRSRALRRREEHLRNLLAHLDTLVYLELAGLYYLDNSTLFLVIRCIIQMGTASPALHPEMFRQGSHGFKPQRTSVWLILFINMLAMLLHLHSGPPSAGEPTRGYLHGSLIIDFVGQKAQAGWLGRPRLCVMDAITTILQLVVCRVVQELGRKPPALTALSAETVTAQPVSINRSSWRRNGIHEGTLDAMENTIELESLLPTQEQNGGTVQADNTTIATSTTGNNALEQEQEPGDRERPAWQALDSLYAGQANLFDFDVLAMFVNQYWDYRNRRRAGAV